MLCLFYYNKTYVKRYLSFPLSALSSAFGSHPAQVCSFTWLPSERGQRAALVLPSLPFRVFAALLRALPVPLGPALRPGHGAQAQGNGKRPLCSTCRLSGGCLPGHDSSVFGFISFSSVPPVSWTWLIICEWQITSKERSREKETRRTVIASSDVVKADL